MANEIDFIGRDRELKLVENLYSEWMTSRSVYFEADGGIGKTRLFKEFQKKAKKYKVQSITKREVKIALVQELTNSEWSREFIAGARSIANEFGVYLIETDANFDLSKMAKDLDYIISKNPDVIIVSLGSSELLRPGIIRAIKKGIKVLTFDNKIGNLTGLSCRIEQDDVEAARIIAKDLADGINYHGKVGALWVKGHAEQERRHNILVEFLNRYPEIDLVDVQGKMTKEAENTSYQLTKQLLLDHPDLKAIWAVFNEFARGVTRALIELGRTDVSVYSFDFSPSDVKFMSLPDSPWVSTVAIRADEGGKIAMRLAITVAYDQAIKRNYLLPMELVRQDLLTQDDDFYSSWYQSNIGWTDWLHSLSASMKNKKSSHLFVSELLDFDDSSLLVAENLELNISKVITGIDYSGFLDNLQELKGKEISSSSESISLYKEKVTRALADSINRSKNKQRIILFFDTVEKLDANTRQRLIHFSSLLENAVCLFAGRPTPDGEFWKMLRGEFKRRAKKVQLKPLKSQESLLYLFKKQEKEQIFLKPNTVEKLNFLSSGHPIIIDLAVEFASQAISLDHIMSLDIKKYEHYSKRRKEIFFRNFEGQLVEHILQLRHPLDRLVFTLSHVYPLTQDMIRVILGMTQADTAKLYELASETVFIKVLPGELGLSLHDEMRRLVKDYIWKKIDPNEVRRRRDSKLAASIYLKKLEDLDQKLIANKERYEALGHFEDSRSSLIGLDIEGLERQYEFAITTWEEHAFYSSPGSAFEKLHSLINKVRRSDKKRELVFKMVDYARRYKKNLDKTQQYHLDYYYARSLVDLNRVKPGTKLLLQLLGQFSGNDSAIYNTLGVASTKIGEYKRAIEYQTECLRQVDINDYKSRANILNQLGYNSRLLGEYDQARKYYTDAQQLAGKLHARLTTETEKRVNRALLASLGNNLAYTFWLKEKDFSTAEHLCRDSRDIYLAIQSYPEVASPETTLAIIARDRGYYEDAVDLLHSAISRILELARFRQSDYGMQLCRAYYHLGWTEWYLSEKENKIETDITDVLWDAKKLEKSLLSFEKSREYAERYNLSQEFPGILHQTASVMWHLSRTTKNKKLQREARTLNKIAISRSEDVHDTRYAIDAILGDAEWDYEIGNYDMVARHSRLLSRKYGHFKDKYKLYFGRMLRIEADIALKSNNPKVAFNKYAEGYLLLNEHRGFGRYAIDRELIRLTRKLEELRPKDIESWLLFLQKKWSDKPENLLLLSWCNQQLLHNRMRIAK